MACGAAAALYVTLRRTESHGLLREHIYHLAFWVLPASLFGTKVLALVGFLLGALRGQGFPSVLAILEAHGFYFGGLLSGLAVSVLVLRAYKVSWWNVADVVAPGLALGNVFGRLGCFAVGCCWGKPTTSWIGVTFTVQAHQLVGVPNGIVLLPTQLIEAFANLIIFVLLFLWAQKKQCFQGQIILIFLILYSVERFVVEIWRDDPRGHIMNFSISQFLSLHIFVLAIALYVWMRSRSTQFAERSVI